MDRIRFWRTVRDIPGTIDDYVIVFEAIVNGEPLDYLVSVADSEPRTWMALPETVADWADHPTPRRVPILQRVVDGCPDGEATAFVGRTDGGIVCRDLRDDVDRPIELGPFCFDPSEFAEALRTFQDTA